MKILPFVAVLTLTGCATPRPAEPIIKTITVEKPVPEPCVAKVDARPRYADQDAGGKADIFEQVRALMLGITQRGAREQKLENAVTSCGGKVG